MYIDHLTDEQMQAIGAGTFKMTESLRSHIKECPQCREGLAAYQLINEAVHTESHDFSPNFEDSIICQLSPQKQRGWSFREKVLLFLSGSAIVTMILILAFSPSSRPYITDTWKSIKEMVLPFLVEANAFAESAAWCAPWLIFGFLLIWAFGSLDRWVFGNARKRVPPLSIMSGF